VLFAGGFHGLFGQSRRVIAAYSMAPPSVAALQIRLPALSWLVMICLLAPPMIVNIDVLAMIAGLTLFAW
jgi:hypothetical protein